eukprot:TRINITY_DN105_c0_g1_i1.p1 TRINITY_DN105_c0_g1~~TRINITY_DN105_c0_g1_i1.p1  ORF type:complete len:367 (+),score=57.07 TRINITY_DN105_c0_g1_i1:801-1901(+)
MVTTTKDAMMEMNVDVGKVIIQGEDILDMQKECMSDMSSMSDFSIGKTGADILQLVRQRLSKKEIEGKCLLLSPQQFSEKYFQESEWFLGQGSYGYVARYEKKGDVGQINNQKKKQYVAIKRQKCSSDEDIRASLTEAYILNEFRHRSMVGCQAIQLSPDYFQVMLDYAGGGRFSDVSSNGFLQSREKYAILLEYLLDIVEGLIWLEQKQIVHRDLRPDNILMFKEGRINRAKLIDFGICKYFGEQDEILTQLTKNHRGPANIFYQAPEELDEEIADVSPKSDIFSFGTIAWQLFSNQRPFKDCHYAFVMLKVPQGVREEIPQDWPPELIQMIQMCWQQDPSQRPTAQQLYIIIDSMVKDLLKEPS